MSYVEKVLQDDERLIGRAHVHWIVYLPAFAWSALAALAFAFTPAAPKILPWVGAALALVAAAALIRAAVERLCTELAVTDRRVIAKIGFLWRRSWEINAAKVEGVEVWQSIPGRLFGFGTVVVKGTGGGATPVGRIARPLAFRTLLTARPAAG